LKTAVIIGAGPAGLTAAYELVTRTDIKPILFEMSGDIGGISKTVNFKGNRIDIGGHRFFSKSDEVMNWWQNILPLQGKPSKDDLIVDRKPDLPEGKNRPDPETENRVMLLRSRLSRIFFLRKFFNYPISLNFTTIKNLGIVRIFKIGLSYCKTVFFPIKDEKSLEDFFINRFGNELYKTFFKDYTEKVWGVPCTRIKPDWGKQRVKGLSIKKALVHAAKSIFFKDTSIDKKNVETTLIDQFFYPKFGPGQLWEEVARIIQENGGEIHMYSEVVDINCSENNAIEIGIKHTKTGEKRNLSGDYFISTMAVKDLIAAMGGQVPDQVKNIAKGLVYRDFITVGVLLKKLAIENETKIKTMNDLVPDNWVYIQERDVKLGRLQIFNNWSPYMVKDLNNAWIGMEYFCNEGDELWSLCDKEFSEFAVNELVKIDIINTSDVLDTVVIRVPKTYPAYFGTYDQFHLIRKYVDKFENLFLIGRNGMHRYNNMDHSMLAGMAAVENIMNNIKSKDNIWDVNSEEDYHEEK